MLSGAFYNLAERENLDALLQVAGLGHEIGLHFDSSDDITKFMDVLSALLGRSVKVFCQHNPTVVGIREVDRTRYVDTYDPRIRRSSASSMSATAACAGGSTPTSKHSSVSTVSTFWLIPKTGSPGRPMWSR